MFELINDIAKYPEFLPWCKETHIEKHTKDEMQASITVKKGPITKTFTTLNKLHPNDKIHISLVKGPFDHLQGTWKLTDLSDGCRIEFHMEFDFKNKLLSKILGSIFDEIVHSMLDAFCKRAEQLSA